MLPKIFISTNSETLHLKIDELLSDDGLKLNHPNVLVVDNEKLGIEQTRKVREHLILKPMSRHPQAVVILSAQILTPEAQNSLLKLLEEPPADALLIMGAVSDENLLPTLLSRCQTVFLDNSSLQILATKDRERVAKLHSLPINERFVFIEKLDDKEALLQNLAVYFREQLLSDSSVAVFIEDVIQAQRFAKQNGNIRAILEYLMLKMPPVKR